MMYQNPELSVVVPVYKEEKNIDAFLLRLEPVLLNLSHEIIFCMDPSPDNTEAAIKAAIRRNPNIKLLVFSRRFGQPAATMAGIKQARGACCVVIDVDLQDPPELIESMYLLVQQGYDVVYATRRTRQGETWVKRLIAHLGYRLIHLCSDLNIPKNTGDFRIMTRRVMDELLRLNETHGFLRGMVAFVGFRQIGVLYDRDARFAGKGNYHRLWGSLTIGLNGLISFGHKPLQALSVLGAALMLLACCLGIDNEAQKFLGYAQGVSWLCVLMVFLSGMQLLSLGLVGEYIARIYHEVKGRPSYIIDKTYP